MAIIHVISHVYISQLEFNIREFPFNLSSSEVQLSEIILLTPSATNTNYYAITI